MAQPFGAMVEVISDPTTTIQNLPVAHPKLDAAPSRFELDVLSSNTHSISQTPGSEGDGVRSSFPPSRTPSDALEQNEVANLVPSWRNPPLNKWRILACCIQYMGNGMTDSATGALIPYLEVYYHIGYATVSLVFVANAVGFIVAACFTDSTLRHLGRSKTLVLSETINLAGFIALVCSPPFPVVVIAFLFFGYGTAINLALNNVFGANLADSSVILGLTHGSYGVGGIIAPIIATTMTARGIPWARFYLVILALRVVALVTAGFTFRGYESEPSAVLHTALQRVASQRDGAPAARRRSPVLEAVRQRTTLLGALFIFAYQGAEVAISGWVISFLLDDRDGAPQHVGYVTAGFWGGITVGRFFVTPALKRLGEAASIYLLTALSIVFQVLTWQLPSLISSAVSVSILGVMLGPIYPFATTIFARLLDRRLQTAALGFISSAGSSGGAIGPFLIGGLAGWKGVWVMHPVCIVLFGLMLVSFFSLPKVRKPVE